MFTYRVVDSPKREDEAMNAERQYLFLDKCDDLFYAATGTRD